MRIAMVGTSYVGLVSVACFSECGTEVISVDQDVAKIDGLKAGCIPIFEPGLTGCRPRPAIKQISDRQGLNLERMKALLKQPIMVDLRNIYDPQAMAEAGFSYSSAGRSRWAGPPLGNPMKNGQCRLSRPRPIAPQCTRSRNSAPPRTHLGVARLQS